MSHDAAHIAALRALAAAAQAAADALAAAAPVIPDLPPPGPVVVEPDPPEVPVVVEPGPPPVIVPPIPEPPPRRFVFPAGPVDVSAWRIGQPVEIPIEVVGYERIGFVLCRGDKDSTWVGGPRVLPAAGRVSVPFTPSEVGGFIKVWPEDFVDLDEDGPRVPASAAPLPPPVVVEPGRPTVPAQPATGAALARAIKARAGLFTNNWERERFAVNFKYTPAIDAYYTALGIGGIRGFVPWDPSGFRLKDGSLRNFWDFQPRVPPTKAQFNRFRPNAEAIVAHGKNLYLDFLDVIGLEDWRGELQAMVEQYIDDACGWVLEWKINPAQVVLGGANEWAGATNPEYEPHRLRLLEIMRRRLPEPWVLGSAPCYWGHPASFVGERVNGIDLGPYNPGPDAATVHFWHAYERRSAGGWASWQAKMDAWERANDRVIMCGEVGAGGIHDGADFLKGDGGWCSHIERQNPAIAGSIPALWACTTGHWTMNRGAFDPRFYDASQIPAGGSRPWDPPIEQTIAAAAARNRAARGL